MAAEKNNIAASSGEGNGYEMKLGLGTIAMLISATGMGLVPLFSRWATRIDMFDGTKGLAGSDHIADVRRVRMRPHGHGHHLLRHPAVCNTQGCNL